MSFEAEGISTCRTTRTVDIVRSDSKRWAVSGLGLVEQGGQIYELRMDSTSHVGRSSAEDRSSLKCPVEFQPGRR